MKTLRIDCPTPVIVVDMEFMDKTLRTATKFEAFKEFLHELEKNGLTLDNVTKNMVKNVDNYLNDIISAINKS